MRVIIAGGRDFDNYTLLEKECYAILCGLGDKSDIEIVSGCANGADKLGERFANDFVLKVIKFPADWDTYGKSAGYKRNEQMAIYAKEQDGVLVAFWDGKSKGTKHMIDLARKHKLIVHIINY